MCSALWLQSRFPASAPRPFYGLIDFVFSPLAGCPSVPPNTHNKQERRVNSSMANKLESGISCCKNSPVLDDGKHRREKLSAKAHEMSWRCTAVILQQPVAYSYIDGGTCCSIRRSKQTAGKAPEDKGVSTHLIATVSQAGLSTPSARLLLGVAASATFAAAAAATLFFG
jgi:hypothetical protein